MHRTVALTKAENKRMFMKQRWYEEGERIGHMLALLAKNQNAELHTITSIKLGTGGVTMCPGKRIEVFKKYYGHI